MDRQTDRHVKKLDAQLPLASSLRSLGDSYNGYSLCLSVDYGYCSSTVVLVFFNNTDVDDADSYC